MVTKHRAWREPLEHSCDLASAAAAPWGLQTQSSNPPRETRNLLCEIISLLCHPQILREHCAGSKNTSTGQTWPLGHQIKTPGLRECGLKLESPNLGEWEAGSFLEEVGLKAEGRGLRRVYCILVDSGDIGKMGGARTLRALA